MAKSIGVAILGALVGGAGGLLWAYLGGGQDADLVQLRHALAGVIGAGLGGIAGAIAGGTGALLDALRQG